MVALLDSYPREMNAQVPVKTCLYMFIAPDSNFAHNCQKLQATQTSFNRWMVKLWSLHWSTEPCSAIKLMKREKSLPKIYWKSGKEPCRNSGDENLNKWDEECIKKY